MVGKTEKTINKATIKPDRLCGQVFGLDALSQVKQKNVPKSDF